MYTTEELILKIEIRLAAIPLNKEPDKLYDPISYTLSLGGKRMRPLLTLMACDMFGGNPEDAIEAAIGLELFHNFTLLHDDIMDNAPLRRGRPTVHIKWNPNNAILSGDTMFALAYRCIANTSSRHLKKTLDLFTKTAIEVCEGQQYDMDFELRQDVTIPEYIEMIRLKTAVLPAAALKIGAIVAGANPMDAENIYRFGENIGIAFQLKDDLLDAFGAEELFGKVTGGDIAANKKTFLYLKSIEKANESDRKKLLEYYKTGSDDKDAKVRKVIEIYKKLDIEIITEKEIEQYYQASLGFLNRIPEKTGDKSILYGFIESLMNRDY
ncbi:MAG: polyprenyl synthetase family protein [Bacteroidales bacterium]|nr:polyprenyl synthetase family protein [Bacteroidales bacterium]